MALYALSVLVHVVAAMAWVGSMIFFSAVVIPVARRAEIQRGAPGLILALGKRYRALAWIALSVLVVTGVTNLYFRGIGWSFLASRAFWATSFGRALGWKLGFVAAVIALTAAHDAFAMRGRRTASWVGRIVLVASLAVVFFATAMVRGIL